MSRLTSIPYPWIDGLTRRQQSQLYSNFQALRRLISGAAMPTVMIASNSSSATSRAAANFVGDDQTVFAQALAALPSYGGRIVVAEGTYTFSQTVVVALGSTKNVLIEGVGRGITRITGASNVTLFQVTGAAAQWGAFRNLSLTAAGTGIAIELPFPATGGSTPRLAVEGCHIVVGTGRGIITRHSGGLYITNNLITGGNGARGIYGIGYAQNEGRPSSAHIITGNKIRVTGNGAGICLQEMDGGDVSAVVANNVVYGGDQGIYVLWHFYSWPRHVLIQGNYIASSSNGIEFSGDHISVIGNHVHGCGTGILVGGGNTRTTSSAILNNVVVASSGTYHINVLGGSVLGVSDVTVAFNKIIGSTPTHAIRVSSNCSNCAVFYNDTFGGFATAAVLDQGTNTRREGSLITTDLTVAAQTRVRKNSGGNTFQRGRLNFIEGAGVSITTADDAVDNEVDITLAVPGSVPPGGTTNQVLAKTSNTNYDTQWIDVINQSLVTAKGDLLVAVAAGQLDNMPIERDGQLLVSDSTSQFGVKWGPRLTVSQTPPTDPQPGDIWIQLP